jgi:hypothetical protein
VDVLIQTVLGMNQETPVVDVESPEPISQSRINDVGWFAVESFEVGKQWSFDEKLAGLGL